MAAVGASRRRLSRLASESGAELIEFAITLPLLLLIGLGIIDFGLLFQRYEVITNAAREGARVAVLPGYANADVVVRVNQYLVASGLTRPHAPPVISQSTITLGLNCATVTSVTVTYPSSYSFVGGIASFFGVSGLASRSLITATTEMRNEVSAGGCGP
jgi:Flp pilus assembly protein TadG